MAIAQSPSVRTGFQVKGISALLKHKWLIAVELVLLVASVALVALVKAHPGPLPGDLDLTLVWQHLVRPHALLTTLLQEVSTLNWPIPAAITIAIVAALLALWRRWLDILVTAAIVTLADGTNFITNQLVQRPRPMGHGIFVLQNINGIYSFPSGHVEHALAFLGMVVFLTYQVRRPALWLWLVRTVLVVDIVLMSPSRVLEGEHWPSDGLAGLLYGGFWLLVGIVAYRWAAARWPRLLGAGEPAPPAPVA